MTQTDNLTTPSRGLPELGRYVLKLNSATTAEERPGIVFTATNLDSLLCTASRYGYVVSCTVSRAEICIGVWCVGPWRLADVCWARAAG